MSDIRVCRTCERRLHRSDMRRLPHSVYYCCKECPDPAPRICLLCAEKSVSKVGLCHTHRERWGRWGKPPLEEWCQAFREQRLNACEVCGKGWNGHHGSRTCSDACDRKRRARIALERFHAMNPEARRRMSLLQQEAERDRRKALRSPMPCIHCGRVFERSSVLVKVCPDEECRKLQQRIKTRECRQRKLLAGLLAETEDMASRLACGTTRVKPCMVCDRPITGRRSNAKFCSDLCFCVHHGRKNVNDADSAGGPAGPPGDEC